MLVRNNYVDSRDKQLHDDGSHQVVPCAESRIQGLFPFKLSCLVPSGLRGTYTGPCTRRCRLEYLPALRRDQLHVTYVLPM